jgi:large subunit ribosomal protein L25
MNKMTLTVEKREKINKGVTRRLRRAGKIPAVIYGSREPVTIAVDGREFGQKFKVISENIIITLNAGDKNYDVLVKDFQEDLIENKIIHLDFYEIDKDRILRTHVPVHLSGTPVGVREGGILEHLLHEVEVECLPKDLPERIELEVTALNIHDSIHIRDLPAREGVRYMNASDYVICHVVTKAAVEVEEAPKEEEEAAAVPAEGGEEEAAAANKTEE